MKNSSYRYCWATSDQIDNNSSVAIASYTKLNPIIGHVKVLFGYNTYNVLRGHVSNIKKVAAR